MKNFEKKRGGSQLNFLDEIIVDNFAGGGGASTGMELATGRPVAIAINHDPDAILMHRTNHPYTEHLQASVWDVDPREVCRGRPVGLAWFSPDCKHFSKAKGAALVDRNIRGLAWIVLRWAGTVRPRVIILENVEEFVTWGPVRKGKPVKKKAGQTFQKWKRQLLELGYQVEHREIVAADLGAPTTRKRFVLVARCDGRPIVWPERTHGPRDSEEVRDGRLMPWKSAAEIIDWSVPCYSVFASKRELKEKYGVNAVRPLADDQRLKEHNSHWEAGAKQNFDTGLYTASTVLYIRVKDYGPKPKVGKHLVMDKGTSQQRTYSILNCEEEAGIYRITMERTRQ